MTIATISSSRVTAPGTVGVAEPPPVEPLPAEPSPPGRRPKPTLPRSATRPVPGQGAESLHPGEDGALPVVEALVDVGREQEPATGRADPERDRHRVVG